MHDFLKRINDIIVKDRTKKEEKRKRGEMFNVFNVLDLGSNEVRLHSAFLAELLNPNGNHGLGDIFLEEFIKIVIADKDFKFSTDSCHRAEKEKYISQVTKTTGGRLDIFLSDNNGHAIIIENKIYAGDQNNQLLRYNNYANQFSDYRLLYLTLDGHLPSPESLGKEEFPYMAISYRDDILRWLMECIKLSYAQPLIRETLVQYSELVKQLTNQDMDTGSKTDLFKLMDKNIESVFTIGTSYEEWLNNITLKLKEQIEPHISLKIEIQKNCWKDNSKRPGLLFYKDFWRLKGQNFCIAIRNDEQNGLYIALQSKKYDESLKFDFRGYDIIFKEPFTPKSPLGYDYIYYEKNNLREKYMWPKVDTVKAVLDESLAWLLKEMIQKYESQVDAVFEAIQSNGISQ